MQFLDLPNYKSLFITNKVLYFNYVSYILILFHYIRFFQVFIKINVIIRLGKLLISFETLEDENKHGFHDDNLKRGYFKWSKTKLKLNVVFFFFK